MSEEAVLGLAQEFAQTNVQYSGDIDRDMALFLSKVDLFFADITARIYFITRKSIGVLLRQSLGALAQEIKRAKVSVGVFHPPSVSQARQIANQLLRASSLKDLRPKLLAKARSIFRDELEKGSLPRDIENRLKDEMSVSRNWRRVVRTEIQRANNQALTDSYERNRDMIAGDQFVATLDTRTCPVCGSYDGNVYWAEPVAGQLSLSEKPEVPVHPNCRCVYTPILRSADELAVRTSLPRSILSDDLDGQPVDRLSYQDWLGTQDEETQKKALGPDRFSLYKQGAPIDAFIADGRALEPEELEDVKPGTIADVPKAKVISDEKSFAKDLVGENSLAGISHRTPFLVSHAGTEIHSLESKLGDLSPKRKIVKIAKVEGKTHRKTYNVFVTKDVLPKRVTNQPLVDIRTRGIQNDWPSKAYRVIKTADGYLEEIRDTRARGSVTIRVHPSMKSNRLSESMKQALLRNPNAPKGMIPIKRLGTLVKWRSLSGSEETRWTYI